VHLLVVVQNKKNKNKKSPFIVVGVGVGVNNIKAFTITMQKQQCVPFALFWSYTIIRTAVNNKKY